MSVQPFPTLPLTSQRASAAPAPAPAPAGCHVLERRTPDGRVLSWDPWCGRGHPRLLTTAVVAWLVVWTVTLTGLLPRLAADTPPPGPLALAFFTAWTLAGLPIGRALLRHNRPRRPERLVLAADALTYDPGPAGTPVPLEPTRPDRRHTSDPVRLTRPQLATLRLSPDATTARCLLIDVGSEPIPIGKHLTPADRRFLHDRLTSWREGARSAPRASG